MKITLLIAALASFLLSCSVRAGEPSEALKAALFKDSGGKLKWEKEIVRPDGTSVWAFSLPKLGWKGGMIPVLVTAGSDEQTILAAATAATGVVDFEEAFDKEYAALYGAKVSTFQYNGHNVRLVHKKSGYCDIEIDGKNYLRDCLDSDSEKEAKRIIDAGRVK